MALNITGTVDPSGTTSAPSTKASDVAPKIDGVDKPLSAGASATLMPAYAQAGLKLSYFVLSIVTGSIVLLLIGLLWMGAMVGSDVQKAYRQVLDPSRLGSEFYMLGRLETLARDFGTANGDPRSSMSQDAATNETEVLKLLYRLPSLTTGQKDALHHCDPVPADTSRKAALDACLGVLDQVRQAALEAASGANNAQIAGEAVDKMLAHRQAFLTFWLQAAQLILLNLLLPLLTALFGYIFGTQQAHSVAQG